MSLLQRYFWRQAFWPLVIALSALATLALLTQSLSTLDLIVENRQSALTFLYITILALPQLIAIIMPLAIFMAMLYALNRLNVDSEMAVAKSVGSSPWQISTPFVRLACMAMIVHLLINLLVQPLSFRVMRQELLSIRMDIASQMVRAGEFITPVPGLTVYAREILPNGKMSNVLIRDSRTTDQARTYTAKTGELIRTGDEARLMLHHGIIQQLADNQSLAPVSFESYQIDLSGIMTLDAVLRLKASDRFLHELFRPEAAMLANKPFLRSLYAEGHARLSSPLYNLALVLLALCFMVRGEFQRMGYGRKIAICAAIGFFIRLLGFAATSLAESNIQLNIMQYAIPVTMIIIGLWYLLNPNKAGRLRRKLRRSHVSASANPSGSWIKNRREAGNIG